MQENTVEKKEAIEDVFIPADEGVVVMAESLLKEGKLVPTATLEEFFIIARAKRTQAIIEENFDGVSAGWKFKRMIVFVIYIASDCLPLCLAPVCDYLEGVLKDVHWSKAAQACHASGRSICPLHQFVKEDSVNRHLPVCTCGFVLTCVLVHVVRFGMLDSWDDFHATFSSPPFEKSMRYEYYRMFTSMFLHKNLEHLFSNMICIVPFGIKLEQIYGSVSIGFILLIADVGGTMMWKLIDDVDGTTGASACAYGLFGMLYAAMWTHWSLIGASLRCQRVPDFGELGWWFLEVEYVILSWYYDKKSKRHTAHLGGLFYGFCFSIPILRYSGGLNSAIGRSSRLHDYLSFVFFVGALGLFNFQLFCFWNYNGNTRMCHPGVF